MACNCGNPCNCSCNRQLVPTGGSCAAPRCGCASPVPYYNEAGACQEDHASTIITEQYATGITTSSAAVVPQCNQTTVLTVPGLSKINANSYLWNPTIGYLQVVSFDYVSQQVVVRLDCTVEGAATPGAAIPACTLFNVTVPPAAASGAAAGDDALYPFLQEDFIIPAAGNCGPAIVTNVNGLAAGKPVQLGSYTLTLSAVVNATTITLCNDTGMVPFSTITAHNGSGQHIVPVILVDASPCTNDAVNAGSLVVCNGGIEQPLAGAVNGQVPVLVDSANNTVEFQLIDVPTLDCTTLAVCLTLTPAGTTYVVTVVDASAFTVGDIVQFTNYPYRFEITNIAGNDITIVIDTSYHAAPAANVNLAIGQGFCLANCCEQLAASIEDVYTYINNPCATAYKTNNLEKWYNPLVCNKELIVNPEGGIDLTPGSNATQYLFEPTVDDANGWMDMTFCNGSCYTQKLTLNVDMWVRCAVTSDAVPPEPGADSPDAGKSVVVELENNYNYDHAGEVYPDCGDGVPARAGYASIEPLVTQSYILDDHGGNIVTMSNRFTTRHHIIPGKEFLASFRPNVFLNATMSSLQADSRVHITQYGVRVSAIMIPVFTDTCGVGVS